MTLWCRSIQWNRSFGGGLQALLWEHMTHAEKVHGSPWTRSSRTIALKQQQPRQWVGFLLCGYFIKKHKSNTWETMARVLRLESLWPKQHFSLEQSTDTHTAAKLNSGPAWSTLQSRCFSFKCCSTESFVVTYNHTHALWPACLSLSRAATKSLLLFWPSSVFLTSIWYLIIVYVQ